jgi:hypothetical protein
MNSQSQYVENVNSVSRRPKRRVKYWGGGGAIASARGDASRVS